MSVEVFQIIQETHVGRSLGEHLETFEYRSVLSLSVTAKKLSDYSFANDQLDTLASGRAATAHHFYALLTATKLLRSVQCLVNFFGGNW